IDREASPRVPVRRCTAAVDRSLDDLGHPRGEFCEVRVAPPVQGQLLNRFGGHNVAQGCALGFEQRRGSAYFNRFRNQADLETEVQPDGLLHIEHDVLANFPMEAGGFDGNRVSADMERSNHVIAVLLRFCRSGNACVRVGSCDGDAWQYGATGILDCPDDAASIDLREPSHGYTDQKNDNSYGLSHSDSPSPDEIQWRSMAQQQISNPAINVRCFRRRNRWNTSGTFPFISFGCLLSRQNQEFDSK